MTTAKKAAPKKAAAKKAAPKKAAAKKAAPKKAAAKKAAPKKAARKKSCYFTTACVEYYGLPDNCVQLTTLRHFRDNVLAKTEKGNNLIKQYYNVAPDIVARIKKRPDAKNEFELIYQHVNEACRLIWQNQNIKARNCYIKMVNHLIKKYS